MKRKRSSNKLLSRTFIAVLLATFVVSLGISYFFLKGRFEFDSSFIKELGLKQEREENAGRKEEPHRLYEPERVPSQTADEQGSVKDSSLAAVEDLIKKKIAGEQIVEKPAEKVELTPTKDLMEALKASVETVKKRKK